MGWAGSYVSVARQGASSLSVMLGLVGLGLLLACAVPPWPSTAVPRGQCLWGHCQDGQS